MSEPRTLEFEAEVSQLLKMMIHSVYSHKEVFLRELISNASDAIDRLRFAALQDDALLSEDPELRIDLEFDAEARTITLRDNGIGMSEEEVMENIGTIARSGTRQFMEQLQEQQKSDQAQLIGQFGVGFYSAFMVADRVEVLTRRADLPISQGVRWSSMGEGSYEIERIARQPRGTEIILHLGEDHEDLLERYQLQQIVSRYSDHIPVPIRMRAPEPEEGEEQEGDGWEVVNQASAMWTKRQGDLEDEDYQQFYKHIAHDFDDPLAWAHRHIEGMLKYSLLLYVPKRPPFDMFNDVEGKRRGVKLYVKRVFIMDDAEVFMPRYLRFVRGIIDSDDLNLNVSREFLQENRVVTAMRKEAIKRVLDLLEELADSQEEDDDRYATFWDSFGPALKEGVLEDPRNQVRVAQLLRFASTHDDESAQRHSLADYVERMQEGQETIYFITAESFEKARNSPQLEIFRDRGIEVLLCSDRIDEIVLQRLAEFNGHSFASVSAGPLEDLDEDASDDDNDENNEDDDQAQQGPLGELFGRIGEVLGSRVEAVRKSARLTSSPACLVASDKGVSQTMDKLLKEAGHHSPGFKPILELNPDHPLVRDLAPTLSEEDFGDFAQLLYEQAMLAEGQAPDDPAGFVKRMNKLMVELMEQPGS